MDIDVKEVITNEMSKVPIDPICAKKFIQRQRLQISVFPIFL